MEMIHFIFMHILLWVAALREFLSYLHLDDSVLTLPRTVLNLRVMTPLGGEVKQIFKRARLRLLENTDTYIMIYNSSKITIMK